MQNPQEILEKALETLKLPKLITREDVKKQYRFLARKYHPDTEGGDPEKMERLNAAYALVMKYIEDFRYTFDEDEISRQFPGGDHAQRFNP